MKRKPPKEPEPEQTIEEAFARAREIFGTADPPPPPKRRKPKPPEG